MSNPITARFVSVGALLGAVTQGIPCVVDVCGGGEPGQLYSFDPGDAVIDEIGGGRGADIVLGLLSQTGQRVYFTPAAPTWTALPSVVHVGTGPAITAALTPGASGPLDYFHQVIAITAGGVNGQGATFSAAYDYLGSTVIDTFPVPIESPATLVGSALVTPSTLALAPGLTLVFALPAAETLTLASPSLALSAAGLKAATATSSSTVTLHAADLLTAGIAVILANPRTVTLTTAGMTPAHVPATALLTGLDFAGNTQSETLVPDTSAGEVTSTKAYASITSIAYSAGGGTDATIAIGYGAAYASIAELLAELNTLAVAAPITVSAIGVQTGAGTALAFATNLTTSGAGGTGPSAFVTLNASPGTGASLFGFANSASATGLAATFAPPWTQTIWTFPVATTGAPYIAGDTYALACVGPEPSISAITAALAVGRANWKTSPFGFFAVTAPPSSAANAAALQAACTALVAAWRADNSCPVACFTGSPFHVASQAQATSDANIMAADNTLANAFSASAAALDSVAPDDCFFPGDPSLRAGTYRRSAVVAAAIKVATLVKLGSNLGEGTVQGVSLRGPDLLTYARDESRAIVKLGPTGPGATGLGFCVLTSTPTVPAQVKFAGGVTRAGNGSNYRSCGAVFVALFMSQTGFAIAFAWLGLVLPTSQVPATLGQLLPTEAAKRAAIIKQALSATLLPKGQDPSVSALAVAITTAGVDFQSTGLLPVVETFVPLGEVQAITLTIVASTGGTGGTTGLSP